MVDGDVREAGAILDAVTAGIDLAAPACLLMGFLLHFYAPGSVLPAVVSGPEPTPPEEAAHEAHPGMFFGSGGPR